VWAASSFHSSTKAFTCRFKLFIDTLSLRGQRGWEHKSLRAWQDPLDKK
jgi:hypothetical protein